MQKFKSVSDLTKSEHKQLKHLKQDVLKAHYNLNVSESVCMNKYAYYENEKAKLGLAHDETVVANLGGDF